MSVVNDVLKNLNQRQSMPGQGGATPYFFQDKPNPSKWLWLGLSFLIVLCVSLGAVIVFDMGQSNQADSHADVSLPDSLFLYDGPSGINRHKTSIVKSDPVRVKDQSIELNTLIDHPKSKQEVKKVTVPSSDSNSNNIVKRTDTSEASGSVVAAINSGDIDGAKSQLSQASQRVQNEVQLRLLLKEAPAALLSEIKKLYPDFKTQPRLLALAAQGQQRSGNHEGAVNLYTQLIPLDPTESRWRAGLAISLETLGDLDSAKRLYKLALSMGTLPYSLKRFSENRLERMQR